MSALRSVFAVPQLRDELSGLESVAVRGRVTELSGNMLRASISGVSRGDLVRIKTRKLRHAGTEYLIAQVVGFDSRGVTLSPFTTPTDVICGAEIEVLGRPLASAGTHLLGTVVSSTGSILRRFQDSTVAISPSRSTRALTLSLPNQRGGLHHALAKKPIDTLFGTGVPALDLFTTVGRGQRMAIIAEPGVGKTSLLADLACGASGADVVVIALIGERGREVNDFLTNELDAETRRRTVVVVSTSDEAPVARMHAAEIAISTAEAFRDSGRHVLLLVDSLTRYARAARELGLAAGEPPIRQGYPASLFAELPRLMERAGNWEVGSITAFFTLLATKDILGDSLIEEVRSLVDGHITLSPALAEKGYFPAVDIVDSLSRLQTRLLPTEAVRATRTLRRLLAEYTGDRELHLLSGKSDPKFHVLERIADEVRDLLLTPAKVAGGPDRALTAKIRQLLGIAEKAREALGDRD